MKNMVFVLKKKIFGSLQLILVRQNLILAAVILSAVLKVQKSYLI